jgi:putative oxygen-independent coproporphyrinogen III oxidase
VTVTPQLPRASSVAYWCADPGFGVYVHIPFCLHRCHYCDFNTYEGADAYHGPYVDALIAHIHSWTATAGPLPAATSVFFGGGTPTLLQPKDLIRILDAVHSSVGVAEGAEVSVEANPETVDEAIFDELLSGGFNRVSIGVQSLAEHVLRGLGRTHSAECALAAIHAARRAGFVNVNADLIYGSPWEGERDWLRSLEGLIEAGPHHISAYALTVENGTPLATLVATGRAADVDPDVQAARHAAAEDLLTAAGYGRYEVSNWAAPGRECRHNVLYWCAGDYAGFGAGAHGHLGGRRFWSVRRPRDFIELAASGVSTEAGFEVLGPSERAGETLMLGLRLASGIDEASFAVKYGAGELAARASTIRELVAAGLLERIDGRLRVSPSATLLGDEVARRLL